MTWLTCLAFIQVGAKGSRLRYYYQIFHIQFSRRQKSKHMEETHPHLTALDWTRNDRSLLSTFHWGKLKQPPLDSEELGNVVLFWA